jgi:DNA-binding NtrC family response regulator
MPTIALVRVDKHGVPRSHSDSVVPFDRRDDEVTDEYVVVVVSEDGSAANASAIDRVLEIARAATVPASAVVVLRPDGSIPIDALVAQLRSPPPRVAAGTLPPYPEAGELAELERAAIVRALELEHNNRTRAARRLGISRRGLIYKLKRYGLGA